MKKHLSASPGKQTHVRFDGDDMTIVTEQNVTPILEQNKRVSNEWQAGDYQTGSEHTHKVAEFPAVLYYELLKKFGTPQQNPQAWFRYLNDSDNRFLRTTTGKL